MATAAAAASITPLLYTKYSCVVLTAARVYPERQKKFLAGQSTTIKANFGGDHFYNHRFHAIMEGYENDRHGKGVDYFQTLPCLTYYHWIRHSNLQSQVEPRPFLAKNPFFETTFQEIEFPCAIYL